MVVRLTPQAPRLAGCRAPYAQQRAFVSLRKSCLQSRKGPVPPRAAPASTTSDSKDTAAAKQRIERLAGRKHGLDKSEEEKKVIRKVIDELAALNQKEQPELTGTKWGLVYSSSTGSSSGKVGPFIGRTEQVFPDDRPGQYFNRLYLGFTVINLLADYKLVRPDRIDVDFQYIEVSLGPLRFKRDFTTGGKGFWKLLYVDPDYRVFETNKGNAFILKRI